MRRAENNRREIVDAGLNRRDLARMGLLTAGGMLIARDGLSARRTEGEDPVQIPGPVLTPFVDPLPIMPLAQPVASMSPAWTEMPNTAMGEGRREKHQRFTEFLPARQYELHEKVGPHRFHRDLPVDTVWGFDGKFPGPLFQARYGEPVLVRYRNELPEDHVGFGMPQTSTHLHNAHTPSESDGFATNFIDPGQFYDNHYPNALAGCDMMPPRGDSAEAMATLWYHDHRQDFTAQNTYRGLVGMYLLFDEKDSGNETDSNPNALRLPSGEYDVPLLFADKVIDSEGKAFFDLFNLDGILGNNFTVNGKIQPYFQVARRKYRFRMLNVGPSRFYEFFLSNGQQFIQICNDGNVLPAPLTRTSVRIAPAERMDVIIDFSKARIGDRIVLQNRLEQTDGRGPSNKILRAPGNEIMRFDVVRDAPDPSVVPGRLRDVPILDLSTVVTTRTFSFERKNGAWAINGKFFDGDEPVASPRMGTAEIWVLQNKSGGWQHPVHIHHEESRLLTRNGNAPPAHELGRKDVFILNHNEEVRIYRRFRDFTGKYMMHCHNTVHEDHAMMLRFDVVP